MGEFPWGEPEMAFIFINVTCLPNTAPGCNLLGHLWHIISVLKRLEFPKKQKQKHLSPVISYIYKWVIESKWMPKSLTLSSSHPITPKHNCTKTFKMSTWRFSVPDSWALWGGLTASRGPDFFFLTSESGVSSYCFQSEVC